MIWGHGVGLESEPDMWMILQVVFGGDLSGEGSSRARWSEVEPSKDVTSAGDTCLDLGGHQQHP